MTKPIVVELTRAVGDYPKGTMFGFDSVSKATRVLGDGTYRVVGYQDGSAYEPRTERKAAEKQPAATEPTAAEKAS